jgi:hypothetical protein
MLMFLPIRQHSDDHSPGRRWWPLIAALGWIGFAVGFVVVRWAL